MEAFDVTHFSARNTTLVLAALLVTAPFTLAGPNEEPHEQHERARELCESADPLMYLAEGAARINAQPVFVPPVPVNADFTTAILHAYAALRIPVTPAELAGIQNVATKYPPAAREPLAMLLQAWATATALSTTAIKDLTHNDIAFMRTHPDSPHAEALAERIDTRLQIAAAQHLLETERTARPLLQKAVDAGAFPRTPYVADPRGYVLIGGTGNDHDYKTRYFVFDPAGDDQYWARIVGATPLAENIVPGIFTPDPLSPAAFGLELGGNDFYHSLTWNLSRGDSYGGADIGVAVMIEAAGDDTFYGRGRSMGSAMRGVGVFVDELGNDRHEGNDILGQSSARSVGIAIDRAGDDTNVIRNRGQGYAANGATSFAAFCDLAGSDSHGNTNSDQVLGMAFDAESTGWFTDLGGLVDEYVLTGPVERSPAADATRWSYGRVGGTGYGQDL